jgi:hypothetical protein
VLLIGQPETAGRAASKSGLPGRGWRLADRPGRIFLQKIVILLISWLIISYFDFFDNFRFFKAY